MSWFQIWTICWQVAVFLTPVVVTACVVWMRSQFVSKVELANVVTRIEAKADLDRSTTDTNIKNLDRYVSDHDARLRLMEADAAKPPSRHTLNNAISKLEGGVVSLGRSVDDLRRQIETQGASTTRQIETLGGYVHTMIDKHIA